MGCHGADRRRRRACANTGVPRPGVGGHSRPGLARSGFRLARVGALRSLPEQFFACYLVESPGNPHYCRAAGTARRGGDWCGACGTAGNVAGQSKPGGSEIELQISAEGGPATSPALLPLWPVGAPDAGEPVGEPEPDGLRLAPVTFVPEVR